jgi:PAS fold
MALWTTDLNLRLTLCLGAGLRGAKNRNEELLGKSVHEYLKCHDPHTTPVAQHYDALRGVASQFEYKRNNRVLELHLEPLRSPSGEIIGCIGAGLDIAERKKTEEKMRYQVGSDEGAVPIDALAARYGGDEFAVLLIDADPGMARQIAGRCRPLCTRAGSTAIERKYRNQRVPGRRTNRPGTSGGSGPGTAPAQAGFAEPSCFGASQMNAAPRSAATLTGARERGILAAFCNAIVRFPEGNCREIDATGADGAGRGLRKTRMAPTKS